MFLYQWQNRRSFTVNRRMVYAIRSVGLGRKGAEKICCLVNNMPPPPLYKSYKAHAHAVTLAAKKVKQLQKAEQKENDKKTEKGKKKDN